MSYYSPSIEKLIQSFEKLPSIGNKTAARLAFYILNASEEETNEFVSSIVNELKDCGKIMLYTNLINSSASKLNDMIIGIEFSKGLTPFGKTILEKSENISEIERRLSMECGKPMKVKYLDGSTQKVVTTEANPIESFAQNNDIPFSIIE